MILPISLLLFGWGLQESIGGLALPIVAAFWAGVGLMGTFNALNTYTAGTLSLKNMYLVVVLIFSRGKSGQKSRSHLRQIHSPIYVWSW